MDEEILEEEDTQKDKYLSFTLDGENYGVDIALVREIIGFLPIAKVPDVPDFIQGIINLRGKIIPVLDMRLRLNKEFRAYTDRTCIIVIEIFGVEVGLIVDMVSEVLTIAEDLISPQPDLKSLKHEYVKGIGRLKDAVILLLDVEELLKTDDLAGLSTE